LKKAQGSRKLFLELCPKRKRSVKKMAYGGRFGGQRRFGPREMYKAICSDCGAECEVPFKPTEGRPVYCRDCWQKRRGQRRGP
jgi:CxxC-x17-CxxC domain-containing protein